MKLNTIEKGDCPALNNNALWLDNAGQTFYAYGGGVSRAPFDHLEPPDNSFWQFKPSGSIGAWEQVFSPSSIFPTLYRVTDGMYGGGGKYGLGFYMGGKQNGQVDDDIWKTGSESYEFDVPGMVVFNSSSGEWSNVSTQALSYTKTATKGTAVFVDIFGPEGLMFPLGGETGSATDSDQYFSFDNLAFYEPVSQQWVTQLADGDIPAPVANLCAVGVAGDNGTYEVGGRVVTHAKVWPPADKQT